MKDAFKDHVSECERLQGLTAEPDDPDREWTVYPRLVWGLVIAFMIVALIVVFRVMG